GFHVTGVQTCALPIYVEGHVELAADLPRHRGQRVDGVDPSGVDPPVPPPRREPTATPQTRLAERDDELTAGYRHRPRLDRPGPRSEERRVGKDGRAGG